MAGEHQLGRKNGHDATSQESSQSCRLSAALQRLLRWTRLDSAARINLTKSRFIQNEQDLSINLKQNTQVVYKRKYEND